MNHPPTVIAPDSSKFFCGPDTIRFRVTATDPDVGDTITLSGPGIPTPIKGVSPVYADVKFYISSGGTYNHVYQVTNRHQSRDFHLCQPILRFMSVLLGLIIISIQ
jgi:hypothetical protein